VNIVKYDAAIYAIAQCKSIDEVKTWADKAAAMQAYQRMAKDKTLELDAAEIRIRAERRLGEMIAEQKAETGLAKPGVKPTANSVVTHDRIEIPKLSDVGISKDLSSRAQKLAAVPAAEFEAEVGQWRERVQSEGARVSARLQAAGDRELKKEPVEPEYTELDSLRDLVDELQAELAIARMGSEDTEEKQQAAKLIAELRQEVKNLSINLKAVKQSRDTFQNEVAELKSQINRQRREIDKITGGRTA
jgi:chromosome segregation ATPase